MLHVTLEPNEKIEGAVYWTNDNVLGLVAFDKHGVALCTFSINGNYSNAVLRKAAGMRVYAQSAVELAWLHDPDTFCKHFVWCNNWYGTAAKWSN